MDLKRHIAWERVLSESSMQQNWSIRCFEEVSSTMDIARDLAQEGGSQKPLIVLAERQLAGRGRQGRSWDSTTGGFSATYVFQTEHNLHDMQGYSLVVGCAVAQALSGFGIEVLLKWPNDIFTQSRLKAGGILIELLQKEGVTYVLTGIGLNLVVSSKEYVGSGVLGTDTEVSVPEVASELSPTLFQHWSSFLEKGFEAFRETWMERALYLRSEMEVQSGDEIVVGTFLGVNQVGHLQLQVDQTQRELHSGHILRVGD